jgi:nucleotide-binding universal stress UspA family protein
MGEKKPVLLILTTERTSRAGVRRAMEKAMNDDRELVVLYIHDVKLTETAVTAMTESGWLGGKATEELYHTIEREYLIQGNALIDHIKEECGRKGVRCRGILRGGDFIEETLRVLDEEGIDEIVAIRRKRSPVSRFFFGSAVEDLSREANRKIEIVDED